MIKDAYKIAFGTLHLEELWKAKSNAEILIIILMNQRRKQPQLKKSSPFSRTKKRPPIDLSAKRNKHVVEEKNKAHGIKHSN